MRSCMPWKSIRKEVDESQRRVDELSLPLGAKYHLASKEHENGKPLRSNGEPYNTCILNEEMQKEYTSKAFIFLLQWRSNKHVHE